MAIGEVAVVACSEDATGIQSTAVEQIPVGEVEDVEDVETQGVGELVESVAVVEIAVVLVTCVRSVISDHFADRSFC